MGEAMPLIRKRGFCVSNSDNLYVFFVKSGQEQKSLQEIQNAFDEPVTVCSIPTVETFFKNHGLIRKEISVLGYVLLESHVRGAEF